jgi:tetratricopeptide (TPR) repeat protein
MKLSFPKTLPKILLLIPGALLVGSIVVLNSGPQKTSSVESAVAEAKADTVKSPQGTTPLQEPGSMSLLLEEAMKLEQQGRPSEAVGAYEKMVETQPDRVEGYLRLGALYSSLGLTTKARELYMKAVERGIADGPLYFNLGYIEEIRGNLQLALEYYLKAEGKLLKSAELFYNIGNVYAQTGDLDNALQYYTRSASMNPDQMDAFVNMSVVSFRKGAYADADFYLYKATLLGYQAPEEYVKALSEKLGKKP